MSDMTLKEAAEAIAIHARHVRAVEVLAAASQAIVQGEQIYRETLAKCDAMRQEMNDHKTRMREREQAAEANCAEQVARANAQLESLRQQIEGAQSVLDETTQKIAAAKAELEQLEAKVVKAKQVAAEIVAAAAN